MAASAFEEKFAAVLNAANRQHGMAPSDDLTRALNALAAVSPQQREAAGPALANTLTELTSPTGAGFLSVWLGAGVESGAAPDLTCRQIIDTFMKWSRTVETLNDSDDAGGQSAPEPEVETIAGLQLMGQGLVAHIARLPDVREWMRDTGEIRNEFERVAHLSIGAAWIMQLLTQCSGQLVVLNTAEKTGVLVRYVNISSCFHLFTLLQGALAGVMPHTRQIDPKLYDIARGRQHGKCSDAAWWHYGQPNIPSAALPGTVWGEMPPSGIVSIDGVQVLLLWPPVLATRSWDGTFFSPILEASLPEVDVLKSLSGEEVDTWWTRLGLPEPQRPVRKAWWRKLFH
jgi:hypothetical protein